MSGKSTNFEDKKLNESNFYKNKKLFKIEDISINKILVSKKESYGKKNSLKYFIGYNDDDVIRPICTKLPQMIGYVKHLKNNNDNDSSRISDKKPLTNYNKIWQKISNLFDKKFDSESVYGDSDKYIWAKIKQYREKITTNFQDKKVTKEGASYKCLSLIVLESVIKISKKYYPQTLLEECKYEIKKIKTENLINDDFDSNSESDTESDSGSDNESDDKVDD